MYDKIMAVFCALAGAWWAFTGLKKYELWLKGGGPGGGFLPVVSGTFVAVMSCIVLVRSFKREREEKKEAEEISFQIKEYLPAAAVVAALFLSYIVGLLPGLFIMIFAWLKLVEKEGWLRSGVSAIIFTAVVYVLFVMLLKIPFPTGMLGS